MRLLAGAGKPPTTITVDSTIAAAAELMDRASVGALVVVEGDRPVGIVTDRDITVRAVARQLPYDARVDGVMSADLICLHAGAPVEEALTAFRTHAIRRLPVVEGDRMVGMVTVDDLLGRIVGDLSDVIRPITGQVLFGRPEPGLPVPTEE